MLTRTASLDAIASASLDAVIVVDGEGTIIGWNALAEKTFGWSEDEAVGRFIHDTIIPEADREAHIQGLARYRSSHRSEVFGRRFERVAVHKDGSEVPIELSIMEVPNSVGDVLVCFARDLTDQRAVQIKLGELQSKLLHLSRLSAMGTMAATLAHELNQPLTAANNYLSSTARLLEADGADALDNVKLGLSRGREAVLRAAETIRSVRLMVDKKPLRCTTEYLATLFQESIRLLQDSSLTTPDVSIAADVERVYANKVQIEQVLVNLLRNAGEALRDCPDPRILLSASLEGDRVLIVVNDNGPGISDEQAKVLFSAFNSTKDSGMGMGLSICRTIVEQHGGRLWVERDAGTSICFTIPAALSRRDSSA
ncbi:MAG TPA: ATP-binding protein [Allosphingosinicella sp.]|uniref:sensor histidine kinase n=1 Tax=Allosphingosinicella sp. TaxID=2823234 RepID=UPI002EDAB577